jgi:DNA-binding NtrC family response regulator
MNAKSILIVDDEKNIRTTLSQALEVLNLPVQSAVNGEEALKMLSEDEFSVVLLDLKMQGMSGMDVLKEIQNEFPYTKVIIITAHGTIDCAVEAMKLGATDFVQKPFSLEEIRTLVKKVLERDEIVESDTSDFEALIELTKKYINRRNFAAALETIKKAVAKAPGRPEAHNLLGAILEARGDKLEAQKFYRTALEVDPTYKSARANLDRLTFRRDDSDIDFGKK